MSVNAAAGIHYVLVLLVLVDFFLDIVDTDFLAIARIVDHFFVCGEFAVLVLDVAVLLVTVAALPIPPGSGTHIINCCCFPPENETGNKKKKKYDVFFYLSSGDFLHRSVGKRCEKLVLVHL
jgi:hypothetical protein